MAKVIHLATGPNGEAFKRTSTSKRYSHVVIGRPSIEHARSRAESDVAADVKNFRQHAKWAVEGFEPSAWMRGKPVLASDKAAFPEAADMAEAFRLKGQRDAIEWLKDKPATAEEHAEARRVAAHAAIEEGLKAGRFSTFEALGWSSRYDLATARFGEFQPFYCDLRAIPCSIA